MSEQFLNGTSAHNRPFQCHYMVLRLKMSELAAFMFFFILEAGLSMHASGVAMIRRQKTLQCHILLIKLCATHPFLFQNKWKRIAKGNQLTTYS